MTIEFGIPDGVTVDDIEGYIYSNVARFNRGKGISLKKEVDIIKNITPSSFEVFDIKISEVREGD